MGHFPNGTILRRQLAATQSLVRSSQLEPLNSGTLTLHHQFLHLGKDVGRHLPPREAPANCLSPQKVGERNTYPRRLSQDKRPHQPNPTSIPFDSKAVIDVEYVPMPHRSGAEAQQGPHLLGNRLLIAVWNALDRLFETLEARMSSPHQWPTGAPAPTEMAEPIADGVVFPRRRANARQGPKPCSFPCGRKRGHDRMVVSARIAYAAAAPRFTSLPHHDLRRACISVLDVPDGNVHSIDGSTPLGMR